NHKKDKEARAESHSCLRMSRRQLPNSSGIRNNIKTTAPLRNKSATLTVHPRRLAAGALHIVHVRPPISHRPNPASRVDRPRREGAATDEASFTGPMPSPYRRLS